MLFTIAYLSFILLNQFCVSFQVKKRFVFI